jgi:hypothetical protein
VIASPINRPVSSGESAFGMLPSSIACGDRIRLGQALQSGSRMSGRLGSGAALTGPSSRTSVGAAGASA